LHGTKIEVWISWNVKVHAMLKAHSFSLFTSKFTKSPQIKAAELQPAAASPKEKEQYEDQQQEADAPSTVITNAWPHVVSSAAGQNEKNHEKQYQWHKQS
jgi:hypothetical protein